MTELSDKETENSKEVLEDLLKKETDILNALGQRPKRCDPYSG